jgi:chemotaxis protein histidine kinase CheA
MAKPQPSEVFMPPNMLKAKLGGMGAGLDMGALKRAEQAMLNLKTEFKDWINADVDHLVEARDTYVAAPDQKTRAALYRASHDLKGQALTFEHPFVARVASSLCNLLDGAADATVSLINAHVDAIRVLVRQDIKDKADPTTTALALELEARVAEVLIPQA